MQRRLRVCTELPPRQSRGAASSTHTEAPASRAVNAAHNAALPPPITSTSIMRRALSDPTRIGTDVAVRVGGTDWFVWP